MSDAAITLSSPASITRDRATWLGYAALAYLLFLEAGLGPAMPSIREQLGLGYTVAGFHFTAIALGATVTGIFGARIARRIGRGRTVWTGLLGITVGAAALIASPNVVGTIAGSLAIGVFGMLLAITVQANLAEQHGERRAVALAEVNLAASAGAIAATLAVAGFEQTTLGWRGAYLFAFLLAGVAAIFFRGAVFPRGVPPAAGRRSAHLPRAFWLCCLVGALATAVEWSVGYWGADFLYRTVALSTSTAAAAMSIFFVSMAVGRYLGSRWMRHASTSSVLIISFALAIVGVGLFWAGLDPVSCAVGLALTGLGIANAFPAVATLATGIGAEQADVAIAKILMTGSLAILIAPQLLGVIGDLVGIRLAFGVTLPLLAVGFAAVLLLRDDVTHGQKSTSDQPGSPVL